MTTIPEALTLAFGHHQAGRLLEAERLYRQILAELPDHADTLHLLGLVTHQAGNHQAAEKWIDRAIEIQPGNAQYFNNRGTVLAAQGKFSEAARSFQQAVQIKPDHADAHRNLANAWFELGKFDQAVECYQQALQINPDYAAAHGNLGNVLREQGKLDEAVSSYQRALRANPDYLSAAISLIHQLQHMCLWEQVESLSERVLRAVDRTGDDRATSPISPFAFLALHTPTTAEQQLRCARQWVDQRVKISGHLYQSAAHHRAGLRRARENQSKITIGYLSVGFHTHPLARGIAELFESHDRDRFEVFGYTYGSNSDSPLWRRLVGGLDRFVDLSGCSFMEASQRIAEDDVDILIDFKGYTQHSRPEILALRPAPIQVNYLGYPGTMGAPFMDYILVDEFVVPMDQQPLFTERLVHLPGCYQVNDSQLVISPQTPTRTDCGLPETGFVYCCFNNSYKISAEVFDVWTRLLKAVPGSVLWLFARNRFVIQNLRGEAEARGVAAERLVFAPPIPLSEHLARHRLADLFLDTLTYNAHTTASDSLWAGCPVLTMAGETFASRVSGSLLRTVGLPELITTSLEGYEGLALRLARDPDELADLRSRLAANRTTCGLFDGARFARHVEKAYRTMWERHISGESPRAFAVAAMDEFTFGQTRF